MSNEQPTAQQRIAEIQKRLEAATPGPWRATQCGDSDIEIGNLAPPMRRGGLSTGHISIAWIHGLQESSDDEKAEAWADAALIAHARDDLPWLLDKLAEAQRQLNHAAYQSDKRAAERNAAESERDRLKAQLAEALDALRDCPHELRELASLECETPLPPAKQRAQHYVERAERIEALLKEHGE